MTTSSHPSQINYNRHPISTWYNNLVNPPSPRDRRNALIVLLLVCILILLVLPIISAEMDEKRPLLYVIIVIASVNILVLVYENLNYTQSVTQPVQASKYQDYFTRSSPFNPRVEETSKRLMQETAEQLESSSKPYKRTQIFQEPANTESYIAKKKPEYDNRVQEPMGYFRGGFNQSVNPAPAPTATHKGFLPSQHAVRPSQPQNSKLLKELDVPQFFGRGGPPSGASGFLMNTSLSNNQAQDPRGRKFSDNNIYFSGQGGRSPSPIYGNAQYQKKYTPSRLLNEEEEENSMIGNNSEYMEKTRKEADELIEKLKIRFEFPDWKNNCRLWFAKRLIPRVLEDNINNLKELYKIMGYFDRRLYEYEYLLKLEQRGTTENIAQKSYFPLITIDELLTYEARVKMGGPVYPSSMSNAEIHRAHHDLSYHVQIRRNLDKNFEIDGYKTFEVRTYILERLLRFREMDKFWLNLKYGNTPAKKRFPTDMEILSNLFFTFINNEATSVTEDKQQIFRNFLLKTNSYFTPPNISDEDVYFRQSVDDNNELHYDIISGKESWKVSPGIDNIFGAIVLFVYHIKTKKHISLDFGDTKPFKEFMQTVIP